MSASTSEWVSCPRCGELVSRTGDDHAEQDCRDYAARNIDMKALLGVAVSEAVHLALIDTVEIDLTDAQRQAARWDIHRIPGEAIARMDPEALAQNVCVRLLGSGGWFVNGVYAGNATPREVLDASIQRPDRDPIDEIAFDLGLQAPDDEDVT